ncbi:MAG: sulfotransferase domain-containing protein, partial [Planctomycetota bacterium]|nr:sulfotransferase domain-containing protein [Planctomycetota bacterium]
FGTHYISCLMGLGRHAEVRVAIEQFINNVGEGVVWAKEELERLRPEAEKYGIKLPTVRQTEASEDETIPQASLDEAAPSDEAEEGPESKPEPPKKLTFQIRKVMSLLQPMRAIIEWMMLKNQIALGEKAQAGEALVKMAEGMKEVPSPDLHNQIGMALIETDDVDRAEQCFERALKFDDENHGARQGLAETALRREDWEATIENALTATELQFQAPRVHFLLGRGLEGVGDVANAKIAFEVAIRQAPGFAEARKALIRLLERSGDLEEIEVHRGAMADIEQRGAVDAALQADDVDAVAAAIARERVERREARTGTAAGEVGEHPPITVVSGLPRSGTSMLMQMLAAGGLEAFTDAKREADEDNPRGYLEHEKAIKIAADSSWVPEVRGGVVKLVAQLLSYLPSDETYRVVFMDRDLREIVRSQRAMLDRLGKKGGRLSDSRMMQTLDAQVAKVERMLDRRPDMDVLFVDYHEVLEDPDAQARRIAEFIGRDLDVEAMARAVDGSLRRQGG